MRRNTEPRIITAKYDGVCKCGNPVKRGQRAMYYPASRTICCEACTFRGERDIAAERSMERYGTDCAYDY